MFEKNQAVWVESLRPDGSTTVTVGRLVEHDQTSITLTEACWIYNTGRRSEFFAGRFDANVEWEPYPAEMVIRIEAPTLMWGAWTADMEALRAAR